MPKVPSNSVTPPNKPTIKPAIINPPIAMNTFEGDSIPSRSLTVVIILETNSVTVVITFPIPSLKPFIKPLTILSAIDFVSLLILNAFLIFCPKSLRTLQIPDKLILFKFLNSTISSFTASTTGDKYLLVAFQTF